MWFFAMAKRATTPGYDSTRNLVQPQGCVAQPRQGRHSLARGASPWKREKNAQSPGGATYRYVWLANKKFDVERKFQNECNLKQHPRLSCHCVSLANAKWKAYVAILDGGTKVPPPLVFDCLF